jgi:hypothetical protein
MKRFTKTTVSYARLNKCEKTVRIVNCKGPHKRTRRFHINSLKYSIYKINISDAFIYTKQWNKMLKVEGRKANNLSV